MRKAGRALALAAIAALCGLPGAGCGRQGAGGGGAPGAARAQRDAGVLRFWDLFNQATSIRMKGDCEAAAAVYEEALAIDPRHEDSLYYLGQCRQTLGRYAGAREAFTRLVSVNPVSARGHLALGALLASPEEAAPFDLPEAEAHLRRAHEINGEETGPMVRIGEILLVRGDDAGARHWIEAAARTNPRSVEAAFMAGYLRWREGDQAAARRFYAKAVGAAKPDAPVKGVLNEGDRKAAAPAAGATHVAAPPLTSPMGRTLFGSFCAALPESPANLDIVYAPVRDQTRRLAARAPAGES